MAPYGALCGRPWHGDLETRDPGGRNADAGGLRQHPGLREWTATETTATAAYDECIEQVDNTMRLRGYPYRPLPETPQFRYRKEIFALCMRRKGYTADD